MNSTLALYGKLLGLFAVVCLMVGFNFADHGLRRGPSKPVLYVPGGDAQRGAAFIREFGCGACHRIPGVRGAAGDVGPSLDRVARQMYVAGVLPNSADNLALWIADPKEVNPRTAMPDLGVRPAEARDIAAYLYGLSQRGDR